MKSEQAIEEALDAALESAFPNKDQGHPQTVLTERAREIMHMVSWLLEIEGFPVLEAYNFHQRGREVHFNVKYPAQDEPPGMIVCGKWFEFGLLSNTAIITKTVQEWRDDFNGIHKPVKMKEE